MSLNNIKTVSVKRRKSYCSHSIRYKSYSIVYLVILIFYLLRPVLPYVYYAINKDYISKHLCVNRNKPANCCHGKCYLDEQLKKSSAPLDSDRNNSKKLVQEKPADDHLKSEGFMPDHFAKNISINALYNDGFGNSYKSLIFVPPRF